MSIRRSNNNQNHTTQYNNKAPRRPPMSIWYHELENPDEAYVLPFFRYLVQLQRSEKQREGEYFTAHGVGGGSGMSARSVKSQEAKLSAPHYVIEAAKKRQAETERKRNQSPEQRAAEEAARHQKQMGYAMSGVANAAFLKEAQKEKALRGRNTNSSNSASTSRSPSPAGGAGGGRRGSVSSQPHSSYYAQQQRQAKMNSSKNFNSFQKYQNHLGDKSYMSGKGPHQKNSSSSSSQQQRRSPDNNNMNQDPTTTTSQNSPNNNDSPPSRLLVQDSLVENSIRVRPIPVRIPDTVIFMRRMPRSWFTYDEDAKMALRLPPLSLDTVKIFDHFCSVAPNSDGICALYFASSPKNDGSLVVEPLRPDDLRDFLGGRPSVLDRCPDGALQKFIPTNGKTNTIYEVLWTPSNCGVYPSAISSVRELPAAAIRSEKDIANAGGAAGLTVASLHDQCFGMIGYFLQDLLRSERRKIVRFSGLFRVDNEQRVWLLGSTCVRCAPMNEPFNNAIPRMPMGLLRPAPFHAPRLDLTTPTLIVGRPPPERPPNSAHTTETYHPFFFTPLHLTKPFSAGASAIDVAAAALPKDLLFSALEHEHELMHFVRETDAFLGCEVSPSGPRPPSSLKNGGRGDGSSANDAGEASYSSMKYSNRGASLRFRNHARLNAERQAASLRSRKGLNGDDDDENQETEEQIKRREYEVELKSQMDDVRKFASKTADLVTETLLDALSGGLSLTKMKNDEWTEFVGTIVMYLDPVNWKTSLKTKADQNVIADGLKSIGCVGYKNHCNNSNKDDEHNNNNEEEEEEEENSAPPVFCFDKLEQPEMEFGPSTELGLTRDEHDPHLHSDGIAVSTPRLNKSVNAKSLQMAIKRFGSRTITPEATEWLWKLQRTFETTVKQRIDEATIIHRDEFNSNLAEEIQNSGNVHYQNNKRGKNNNNSMMRGSAIMSEAEEQLRKLVHYDDHNNDDDDQHQQQQEAHHQYSGIVSASSSPDYDQQQNHQRKNDDEQSVSSSPSPQNNNNYTKSMMNTSHHQDQDDASSPTGTKNNNSSNNNNEASESPWSTENLSPAATTKKSKSSSSKKSSKRKKSPDQQEFDSSFAPEDVKEPSPMKTDKDYEDDDFEE